MSKTRYRAIAEKKYAACGDGGCGCGDDCNCGDDCSCGSDAQDESSNTKKGETNMQIKVLGTGCATCKKLYKIVDEAVAELGADANVVHVTDMTEIVGAGIMQTPGLIINDKVKSMGRLPKAKEIKKMIEEEMQYGKE